MGGLPVGNDSTPTQLLFPFIANSQLAQQFIKISITGSTQTERAITCFLTFTVGGVMAKVGDMPTNATMGGMISAFSQFMAHQISNANGNMPFVHLYPNKRVKLIFCTSA